MFLFSRKKKKGLKGFMVLVGTADSLAEHTLYEYKVYRPDAVVCVGQAGGRAAITPEMIAVNIMDARIPDNAGNKPCHELIIKEGREAYFSSLPVKDIEKNLNDNGIPSSVSYGADNE